MVRNPVLEMYIWFKGHNQLLGLLYKNDVSLPFILKGRGRLLLFVFQKEKLRGGDGPFSEHDN